jgi:hypothetical protein
LELLAENLLKGPENGPSDPRIFLPEARQTDGSNRMAFTFSRAGLKIVA